MIFADDVSIFYVSSSGGTNEPTIWSESVISIPSGVRGGPLTANDFSAFLAGRKYVQWHLRYRIYAPVILNHPFWKNKINDITVQFFGRRSFVPNGLFPDFR